MRTVMSVHSAAENLWLTKHDMRIFPMTRSARVVRMSRLTLALPLAE
jgi:hypothetical protein